ncbi:MAG TPA: hypothetical protein VMF58_10940 [Rhizomicrobium sp.]|nr:hypothetical protein [Rhizomicrobium sp.]
MRKATILLCTSLVCLTAMGCKPQHAARDALRGQRMEQREDRGDHRGGGGLRRACRADIEQYCAADQTGRDRRECLQTHIDKLSADCKTALQDRMNHRGGGRRNRDQDNGTTNGSTTNGTNGGNDKDDD